MKRRNRNSNEDYLNTDDLGDLSDINEAISGLDDEEKPKKSKKGKIILFIILLIVILLIVAGLMSPEKGNSDNKVEGKQTAELELVNSEQVNYAKEMCSIIPTWEKNMVPMKNVKTAKSPLKVRDEMVFVLESNAAALNKESKELAQIPSKVYDISKRDTKDILVTDNVLKIGDQPDEKVSQSAQSLSTTLSGYAGSINTMAQDLKKVAPYDEPGIRSAIENVNNSFDSLNSQFTKDVGVSINDNIFDNVVTMQKVSEIKECNGAFINPDDLKKEKGQEIEQQAKISSYALQDRCRGFLASSQSVPEDSMTDQIKQSVTLCKESLASGTDYSKDPYIQSVNIDLKNENNREKVNLDYRQTNSSTKSPTSSKNAPKK